MKYLKRQHFSQITLLDELMPLVGPLSTRPKHNAKNKISLHFAPCAYKTDELMPSDYRLSQR
jgi:hypothetical protein